MSLWGQFRFLPWELVSLYCYLGDSLLSSTNQQGDKINANNRVAKGLAAFKKAVNPSFAGVVA